MEFFEKLDEISIGSISLATILSAIVILVLCFIAIQILCKVIRSILGKGKLDKALQSFIMSVVNVALWLVTAVIVATSLGIPTASLVAVVSVAGLALSLSVQGIMGNVFSGMTLIGTKPFSAGDYVELNGVQGVVKELKIFYTSVLTIDNKIIHIPNSEVASAKIINFSSEPLRRIDMLLTASYDSPTEKVKEALYEACAADERLLTDPAPFVGIMSYQSSAIEYVLRVWVKSENYWGAYFQLNEKIRESFEHHGVQMTYDHINVHMIKDEK